MKFVMFATMAAIGIAALATSSQAASFGATKAGISSPAISQVACHWHRKRVRVARHVDDHGVVHRAHWVTHKVKVCS